MIDNSKSVKERLLPLAQKAASETPGAFVEEKTFGLSWHHRLSDPGLAKERGEKLRREILDELKEDHVVVIPGKEVLEFQPAEVSKGAVAKKISLDHSGELVVAVGDDRSDEDMFMQLNGRSITMHVGGGPTNAAIKVKGVDSVRRFLSKFIDYKAVSRETMA